MFENLDHIRDNYKDLELKLADPEVLSDIDKFTKISREYNSLKPIVEKYEQILSAQATIEENQELMNETNDSDILMIRKMLLLKSVQVLVEMKLVFLLVTFIECIICMLIRLDLKLKK